MEKYKNFNIDGIGKGEHIIKIIHRNWFDIASQFFMIVFMMALIFASFILFFNLVPDSEIFEGYEALIFFVTNTFILSVWIFCFLIWIDYYFDIWIITNEKIINIEQKGLFVRRVSEIKYEKIQDVTAKVTGLLQTVINFGDVQVQTAADTDNVLFRRISDPYELKNLLVKMQKEKERKRTHDFEEAIKERLLEK